MMYTTQFHTSDRCTLPLKCIVENLNIWKHWKVLYTDYMQDHLLVPTVISIAHLSPYVYT